MKTYCKRVDPSDVPTIEPFIYDALYSKLGRKDYSDFVSRYCNMAAKEIRKKKHAGIAHYPELDLAVQNIARDIALRIKQRSLDLEPIRFSERTDGLSKKTRIIGIESVMQQLMEHVAVGCMGELWTAKYEYHQYASIKGKGQLKGARTIQKWTNEGKTKYFVKLDVRKCFQSLNRETAMRWLRRDIRKNEKLLWFVDALLKMHVNGLVIGSLLSQFLCNYFMSYAYRFVMSLFKERRGRKINLVTCALFYMDDILLCGNDRRNLVMAVRKLIAFMQRSFRLEIKTDWHVKRHKDCGIDMMGYVVKHNGKIRIRPRVFIRARRAFVRSAEGDNSIKIQTRVSSYYGFFKAARIKKIKTIHIVPKTGKRRTVNIRAIQKKSAIMTSAEARRDLTCAA